MDISRFSFQLPERIFTVADVTALQRELRYSRSAVVLTFDLGWEVWAEPTDGTLMLRELYGAWSSSPISVPSIDQALEYLEGGFVVFSGMGRSWGWESPWDDDAC